MSDSQHEIKKFEQRRKWTEVRQFKDKRPAERVCARRTSAIDGLFRWAKQITNKWAHSDGPVNARNVTDAHFPQHIADVSGTMPSLTLS